MEGFDPEYTRYCGVERPFSQYLDFLIPPSGFMVSEPSFSSREIVYQALRQSIETRRRSSTQGRPSPKHRVRPRGSGLRRGYWKVRRLLLRSGNQPVFEREAGNQIPRAWRTRTPGLRPKKG